MKTISLIKIAAVVLLGIAINGTAQANPDKYTRKALPTVKEMTHSALMSLPDFRHYKVWFAQPVEDWMFEADYLSPEPQSSIEPWMLEEEYLNEDTDSLENWMFSETHLSEPQETNQVESWMYDANYLSR